MKKVALITGITGQDGSYLAEFLLEKGYQVHGVKRRSSSLNTERIDHLFDAKPKHALDFTIHYGDLTDSARIIELVNKIKPDEIYNLAAQSHVSVSFEIPEYTSDVNALGTLRMLEAIRTLHLSDKTKFYQASTSELFGKVQEVPQSETTPFHPRSPYAIAKLYSYWMVKHYREAHNMFACNGILFNHESPRRGETFVTRKITRGLSRVALGLEKRVSLGNMNALRDWGHAKDYVKMQWLMLQSDAPSDFVIATGVQHSVRDFVTWACQAIEIEIEFEGRGLEEIARVKAANPKITPNIAIGQVIVDVKERYFRPTEVDTLLGDPKKAAQQLDWKPTIGARDLAFEMMQEDFAKAKHQASIIEHKNEKP